MIKVACMKTNVTSLEIKTRQTNAVKTEGFLKNVNHDR